MTNGQKLKARLLKLKKKLIECPQSVHQGIIHAIQYLGSGALINQMHLDIKKDIKCPPAWLGVKGGLISENDRSLTWGPSMYYVL